MGEDIAEAGKLEGDPLRSPLGRMRTRSSRCYHNPALYEEVCFMFVIFEFPKENICWLTSTHRMQG